MNSIDTASSFKLVLEDVTLSYQRVPAVHHVSLTLHSGRCVALMGPNGAGKTTLLKAIAGLLPLETGRISHRGESAALAYVPQREAVDWDFPITIRGLVEMGRYPALGAFRRFGKKDHQLVEEAIILFKLEDYADRQISALSGGQQQRAFLARAWAQQSDIYLLDEPFSGLDDNAARSFLSSLHLLREQGKLIVASHHDFNSTAEIFDTVVLLNGELIASGPTESTFTPKNLERAFSTQVFSGHKHD
ncbi:MAG: metal ABC transporter ATP-binding protein [Chthoniobacterales bacterium]